MAKGLFEISPGRPNGYLEYQASQIDPNQQLANSFSGSAFVESFTDETRKQKEAGTLDTSPSATVPGSVDNRAKMKKKGLMR